MILKPSQRAAFIGKTGSGKSYAARLLTAPLRRLIVLDPKGMGLKDWGLETWGATSALKVKLGSNFRLRVPPTRDWRPYLDAVWGCKDVTIYIDELYHVTRFSSYPTEELAQLYTAGREKGIGLWAAMQRPAWVPAFARSECEWFFIFRLLKASDRKLIEQDIGVSAVVPARDPHGLWVYNADWDSPKYYRQIVTGERG